MNRELVRTFLETIASNKELSKEVMEKSIGKSSDEIIKYYAELAPTMDFNLSEEDFRDFFDNGDNSLKERTDSTIAKIEELDVNELSGISGGYDGIIHSHPDKCDYSFKDRENCWFTDGCDQIFLSYGDDYVCHSRTSVFDCGMGDDRCYNFINTRY